MIHDTVLIFSILYLYYSSGGGVRIHYIVVSVLYNLYMVPHPCK